MTRKIPVGDGLGGSGAGGAEGVVAGAATGDFCAGLPAAAVGQNKGGTKMVAENVEQAVVSGRWVARDAGSNGLTVGKEQAIRVGITFARLDSFLIRITYTYQNAIAKIEIHTICRY